MIICYHVSLPPFIFTLSHTLIFLPSISFLFYPHSLSLSSSLPLSPATPLSHSFLLFLLPLCLLLHPLFILSSTLLLSLFPTTSLFLPLFLSVFILPLTISLSVLLSLLSLSLSWLLYSLFTSSSLCRSSYPHSLLLSFSISHSVFSLPLSLNLPLSFSPSLNYNVPLTKRKIKTENPHYFMHVSYISMFVKNICMIHMSFHETCRAYTLAHKKQQFTLQRINVDCTQSSYYFKYMIACKIRGGSKIV